MTTPTLDSFPTLGFVPCAGDHLSVDKVGDQIKDTAEALGEIRRVLNGAANGEWRGKAAIAFRELLDDDYRPKIEEAYDSFDQARSVIHGWSDYMRTQQKAARDLEEEAAEAEKKAEAAAEQAEKDKSSKGKDQGKDSQGKDTSGSESGSESGSDTGSGTDPVEEVRKRARTLRDSYEHEGREAAKRLQNAIDIAPNEPGFWERLGDAVTGALDAVADAAAWLHDEAIELLGKLAPLLDLIGDIAGLLSTITGLLAFIPGLQFLGAASLILSGVALGAHYLSAVGTTGSLTKALVTKDVIMDAVGFGLGMAGARIGDGILSAAQASGAPTRIVPQLIGPAKEMPYGYFQLATKAYEMSQPEMLWRVASYHTTWTGNIMTVSGARGTMDTVEKIVTGDVGPLVQKPAVTQ